ncbi:MAG: calcium/sodium antiporter [Firmicutes bacterium]|nr:calcium/sodium antiporter [Bacillota bacterium]
MLTACLLFAVGLVCLIKGGDWFVDGATAIAEKFHVPDLLIGATVVSIGTTIPEVMVSATSALSGHGEIAYGNAIGSIICNTALIAAITITAKPGPIERKSLKTPALFFALAAAYYLLHAYVIGSFSRLSGLLLLAIFAVYILLQVKEAKKDSSEAAAEEKQEEKPLAKSLLLLAGGAAVIAVGADLLVDNGTIIARTLGVPEAVIALTFIALGTSLPELVTAITALMKGHSDLSLGNVIGANLFNLVLVSGLSITLQPFDVPVSRVIGGMNASLVVDLPVMVLVMSLMILPAFLKEKLSRSQGIVLLLIYAAFCTFQFMQ